MTTTVSADKKPAKRKPTKRKPQPFNIFKLTPKQFALVAELCVYFRRRRDHCVRMCKRAPWFEEPIPLQKIYELHKCNTNDKKAVKLVANIFFEQATRGDSIRHKCSTWKARDELYLNYTTLKMINDLFLSNIDHISSVRAFMNTPEEKNTVEVTTSFSFKDAAQAEAFRELITAALERSMRENGEA